MKDCDANYGRVGKEDLDKGLYMKYLLITLLTLCIGGYSFAEDSPSMPIEQLQNIIDQFQGNSPEDALRQLELHENNLAVSVRRSKNVRAYMLLGQAYFYAEMDAKAIETLNSALQLDASQSKAHYLIGLMHSFADDFDSAEESFRKAIAINSNDEAYFVALGHTLESKNAKAAASTAYKKALSLNSKSFDANSSLATIHAEAGDVKNAKKHFLAALELKPDDLDTHYNLGQLYQNLRQHKLAITQFERVVEINPNDWRTLAKLVQENEALGQYAARDSAIDAIYKVWRLNLDEDLKGQGFYIREQSELENGKLFVLEYFELKGERARKFVFKLRDEETEEVKFEVSLGSYNHTTNYARAIGSLEGDERRYHLDGYAQNGNHYTYAFFNGQPEYEVAKDIALKALAGKYKSISSTIISDGSNTVTVTPRESEK